MKGSDYEEKRIDFYKFSLQLRKLVEILTISAVGLVLLFPSGTKAENGRIYTLAIVPQLPAVDIYKRWTPFVKKLSEKLGVNIRIITYSSMQHFQDEFLKGVPDLAFMNPYHEVLAKKGEGYIPLVRDRAPLVGILVAHKGRDINSAQDLRNKEIAFPAPNAFAASLYVRALLTEKEKIPFKPLYVKTHTNVYINVALGKTAAGGGVNNTLAREPADLQDQLKIIYETPGVAPHPLSAHPRVPEAFRKKFIEAVLGLAGDKDSKNMLDDIQMPDPVKADYRKDYMPLERLGIAKYIVKESE